MSTVESPKNLDVLVKALSATRGAVTIADARKPDMPLTYFNQAFMELTGYDEAEIINTNCRFLQGADTDRQTVAEIRTAIKEERDIKVVLKNYRKDGTEFWNDLMMSPVFDKTGALTHYIGLQLDITQKVEQQQREQQARELAMQNASLKKEADMLARLNEAKDDFISIASHQLRTPATIVKQNLGLLTEGFLGEIPDGQSNAIHTAYESNDRLIKIINELLRHARISANDYALKTAKVDLAALLREMHAAYSQKKVEYDRTIRLDLQNESKISVIGDSELLRSAVENLVNNAISYSYEGTKIDMMLTIEGSDALISIRDEGIGVKQKDKPKLFKKFSRIKNDHQFNIGGTGLGLYWVKTVVDMHNGDVMLEDNVPQGSVFTVRLPLAQ